MYIELINLDASKDKKEQNIPYTIFQNVSDLSFLSSWFNDDHEPSGIYKKNRMHLIIGKSFPGDPIPKGETLAEADVTLLCMDAIGSDSNCRFPLKIDPFFPPKIDPPK